MCEAACIRLDSLDGMELEAEARDGRDGSILHSTMLKVFAKQIGNSCCGIQSSGMVLNALYCNRQINNPIKILENLPYLETKMFDYPETLRVTNYDRVETEALGCTLDANILKAHGLSVQQHNIDQLSCSEFRNTAVGGLSNPDQGIIANYFMNDVDPSYPLYGHHSPLGGYHRGSDRFLVLDVWKDTPESWVKTEVLYKAMNTVDTETGRIRGFLLASA